MDRLLKKLESRLQSEAVEGVNVRFTELRKSESKMVNVAEILAGPLYVRVVPQTDDYRLLSLEVYLNKNLRHKLTDVSPELATDLLVGFAKEVKRPGIVQQLKAKSMEPYTRISADEEEPDDAELDALIQKLEEDWGDGGMPEDGDQCKDVVISDKNLVRTFPKDVEKVESGKTPIKRNVNPQSFERDGVVKTFADGSRLEEQKEIHGNPTRLNESLKNSVFIYTLETGAIWVPKHLYEQYKLEKDLRWGYNDKGEICLLKENQQSTGKFIPVNLRG